MIRTLVRWVVLVALVVGASKVFVAIGVPAPLLFAGLAVGITYALRVADDLSMPHPASLVAQGLIGILVGIDLHTSTLRSVGAHFGPVTLVVAATLLVSVFAGLVLSRLAPIDQATSSFGMIAGGATGIVAISGELGADQRLVAVIQYLRVLIVVSTMPIVAGVIFGLSASKTAGPVHHAALLPGLRLTVVALGVGILFARLVHLPAGGLLGPLLIAAVFALTSSSWAVPVPRGLQSLAFAIIGLEVGLRFTVASIRHARRILPAAIAIMVVMTAACAGLGLVLSSLANMSKLDGYLATTPGGLSTVLAITVGSSANATFILSVQILRTCVMLLGAPALARLVVRAGPTTSGAHARG